MKRLNILLKKKVLPYFFLFLLILLLTFIAVRPSFNLALSGDDWLLHYTIWHQFELQRSNYFNPLGYICTYCPHYFFLSIIKFFWGINPFYHYLSSYFARIIVALSIFLLIKKITKEYSLAFLASIFFSVNYLGIETTDWVFNMSHYLGIAVVCIFFIIYYKAQSAKNITYIVLPALLFAAALIISPPRMHGLFPLVVFSELILFLIYKKSYSFKYGVFRTIIIFLTYLFIFSWLGKIIKFLIDSGLKIDPGGVIDGYGSSQFNLQRVQQGLSSTRSLLSLNQTDFIVNPFATLGNYFLPDRLLNILPLHETTVFGILILMIWVFITILTLKLFNFKKHQLIYYLTFLTVWTIFIYILKAFNQETFTPYRITLSLLGGFSTIFTIFLFFLIKKELPVISYVFAISFGWMNTFYFFPQLLEPFAFMFSWSRYAVQAAAGLSIWVAVIIYLVVIKLREKRLYSYLSIPYTLAFSFFIMHLIFTNNYLQHVGTYRSVELDKKLWNQITTSVPKIVQDSQSIFFLASHPAVFETAEMGLRFGFSARSAMFYNITNININPNMIVNNYTVLLSTIFKESVNLNNVYGFYLDENQQLFNITDQVRQKLTEDLEALNEQSSSANKGTLTLPQ